jgi:hypothetical protein
VIDPTLPLSYSYYPVEEADTRMIVWDIHRPSLPMPIWAGYTTEDGWTFLFFDYATNNRNVVAYNEVITGALGCNSAVYFLGSSEQAKSIVY